MTSEESEKVLKLLPENKKKEFAILAKEFGKNEKSLKELRESEKTLEDNQKQVFKKIATFCSLLKINQKKCPHPIAERTGAGGYFCIICNKMVGMD